MIRKAILVMLTLAAVGVLYMWVCQDDLRFNLWENHVAVVFRGWTAGCIFWNPENSGASWKAEQIVSQTANGMVSQGWFGSVFLTGSSMNYPESNVSVLLSLYLVPAWLLFVLFVAYPTFAFIRGPLRRYRRHKRGRCLACGYDLRGSQGGCPECGATRN